MTSHHFPYKTVLIVATISFGLGFSIASHLPGTVSQNSSAVPEAVHHTDGKTISPQSHNISSQQIQSSLPKSTIVSGSTDRDLETLWKELLTTDSQSAKMEALDKLDALVAANPSVLKKIMDDYNPQSTEKARDLLKYVLLSQGDQAPEVLAFSMRLATGHDPISRKDGFELLRSPGKEKTAEVRSLAINTLMSEQDPAILSLAAGILRDETIEPIQSEIIKTQLHNLTGHQSPAVRAESLQTLAKWDKTGSIENTLHQALSDNALEVREAAIAAVGESGTRSERVKNSLLDILQSNEEPLTKSAALEQLERFPLNQTEYKVYSNMRSKVSDQLKAEAAVNGGG